MLTLIEEYYRNIGVPTVPSLTVFSIIVRTSSSSSLNEGEDGRKIFYINRRSWNKAYPLNIDQTGKNRFIFRVLRLISLISKK